MKFNSPFESAAILYDAQQWGIEIMLYQSILHQGAKEIGQTPHSWRIYFSPLVALPLRGEKSNPFFSSVKDWAISLVLWNRPRTTEVLDGIVLRPHS